MDIQHHNINVPSCIVLVFQWCISFILGFVWCLALLAWLWIYMHAPDSHVLCWWCCLESMSKCGKEETVCMQYVTIHDLCLLLFIGIWMKTQFCDREGLFWRLLRLSRLWSMLTCCWAVNNNYTKLCFKTSWWTLSDLWQPMGFH